MPAETVDRKRRRAPLEDAYLPLPELATYSGLAVRTLERFFNHPVHPLPYYRIGGRIVVKRSEFDDWARFFRHAPEGIDLDAAIDAKIRGE
jgi:hypothetical protein